MTNRQSMVFAAVLFVTLLGIGAGIFLWPGEAPPGVAIAQAKTAPATLSATEPETLPAALPVAELVIKKAMYGDLPDGAAADVTKIVADKMRGDKLSIAASNDNFGDPAPNIRKKLRVTFVYDDVTSFRVVDEGETLSLPPRLIISRAVYGDLSAGSKIVVTQQVAEAVRDDMLSINATNDNFTDPAVGIVKQLTVEYVFDHNVRVKTAGENETLSINSTGD